MAFPHVFSSGFEAPTTPFGWDTEADTGAFLDVPHVTQLVGGPQGKRGIPFRGAYALRWQSTGDTNAHTLEEGDIDIAADTLRWVRFYLFLGEDFAATADDTFQIFQVESAGNVVEAVCGLRITATTDAVEIGVGETAPTAFAANTLAKGVWHCIELRIDLDDGASNDGSIQLFVNGETANSASVGSLDQAAVVEGLIGITGGILSTTTGTILFDEFAFDDLRIHPIRHRYPETEWVSHVTTAALGASNVLAVGSGVVTNLALYSGAATNNILRVWDSAFSNTELGDESRLLMELKNTVNSEVVDTAAVPFSFTRGLAIELIGTNPRAMVQFGRAFRTEGTIRDWAQKNPSGYLDRQV